ncbi:hypothetical protein NQ315_011915 [Exocentrus adspersus]|uniref:Uncharacterized protein n=1 Tax=Exocentrus adspersus TaxID=1586481 RepID=A0AAV8W198_9CUCU|nr:hypothetical protein NQ315_011915 [Exocentrus adspersus]
MIKIAEKCNITRLELNVSATPRKLRNLENEKLAKLIMFAASPKLITVQRNNINRYYHHNTPTHKLAYHTKTLNLIRLHYRGHIVADKDSIET